MKSHTRTRHEPLVGIYAPYRGTNQRRNAASSTESKIKEEGINDIYTVLEERCHGQNRWIIYGRPLDTAINQSLGLAPKCF